MKRKHIEDLILLISPDTDVHLFPKRDLLAVLKHEILHLKVRLQHLTGPAADEVLTLEDEIAPGEMTPAEAFAIFNRIAAGLPAYPAR